MKPTFGFYNTRHSPMSLPNCYPDILREQKEMELWREVHRGIVGRPVFARYNDQHFYPGTVHGWKSAPAGYLMLSIRFANGVVFDLSPEDVVMNPLLSTNPKVLLCFGQRVIVMHRNEKRDGFVLEHHVIADRVHIRLDFAGEVIIRHLSEICLSDDNSLASKPSMLNCFPTRCNNNNNHLERLDSRAFPTESDNKRNCSSVCDDEPISKVKRTPDEIQTAAVALTTLSLSPAASTSQEKQLDSPKTETKFVFPPYHSPRLWRQTNETQPNESTLQLKNRRSQSFTATSLSVPKIFNPILSEQSKRPSSTSQLHTAAIDKDEGFGSSESSESIEETSGTQQTKNGRKRIFRCLWKGCGLTKDTLRDIISHVRENHLGPTIGEVTEDDDEMFYFDDVEVDCYPPSSILSSPNNGPVMCMQSAPPSLSTSPTTFNGGNTAIGDSTPMADGTVESDGGSTQPGSCRNKAKRRPRSSTITTIIPIKTKTVKRSKSNNEGMKKCRKIYGMENRQQWCTQCRWKKACARFVDQ